MQLLTYGDPTKPKILAIHPMLVDSGCVARILGDIREQFCIVAPDLSGHGSDPGHFVSAAADAKALLAALTEKGWTEVVIIWSASLGAVVALELLTHRELHAEAMVFESLPLVKDSPFLRRMVHNTLISKRRQALERPAWVRAALIKAAGPVFGPVMEEHLFRMQEQELENIAVSCVAHKLPKFPPERQCRMFFDFGSEDFMAKNVDRMLKRTYPQAHVTLHKGCNHCQYPARLKGSYGRSLLDDLSRAGRT